jgi:hypothetical protein
MSNQSIIEHKANMYYVEYREDYLLVCHACEYKKPDQNGRKSKASSHCQALILAILEGWMNNKRGRGQSMEVYMSYPQWIESMYGMFGRNVIIDSLEELLGEGLISRRPVRLFGKDTYAYLLNTAEINKRIRALPDRDPQQVEPQGVIEPETPKTPDTTDPFTSKRVDDSEDETTRLKVNATRLKVNATRLKVNGNAFISKPIITSTNNHIDSTQKESVFADAENTTPSPISLSGKNSGDEQETAIPTEKSAAPKKARATTKKSTPSVSEQEKTLVNEVHTWVNRKRGYSLQGRGTVKQCIDENKACIALANLLYRGIHLNDPEGCTWEDLEKEWTYIANHDRYWSQPEHRRRIGAHALLQMFAQTMEIVRNQSKPKTSVVEGSTRPELKRVSGGNQDDSILSRVYIAKKNTPAKNIRRIGQNEGSH